MIRVIWENNDMVLLIKGLKDAETDRFILDAVVTVSVYKSDGVLESTGSWPLSMPYVASSKGDYRTVLASTLDLTANEKITVIVTVLGSGIKGEFKQVVKVKARND